jgi:hypothetical protein
MEKVTQYCVIQFHFSALIAIIISSLVLMMTLFVCITIFAIYKKRREQNILHWLQGIADLINEALFLEEGSVEDIDIPYKIKALLKKKTFRQCVIDELIKTKKNISGAPTKNLVSFYNMLRLEEDAYKKLFSGKWHIQAKGNEELGIMEQHQFHEEIYKLAVHSHEWVRHEAQCAIVKLLGAKGLSFLDQIEYSISQFQQIQLLHNLQQVEILTPGAIENWLKSSNESVVEFAIRLATKWNSYTLHDHVAIRMKSASTKLKLTCLEFLSSVPNENTADELIQLYFFEDRAFKIAVIKTLSEIGYDKHVPFLYSQMQDADAEIKNNAAKSLFAIQPDAGQDFTMIQYADATSEESLQLTSNEFSI